MSKVLVTEAYLSEIAEAIRAKLGSTDVYTPSQMSPAISSVSAGETALYTSSGNMFYPTMHFNSNVTSVSANAYSGINQITQLTLNDEIVSTGIQSFYACRGLTAINFGIGITAIGNQSFRYCSALTSVDLSQTEILTIGTEAFGGCADLISLSLPNTLTSIGAQTNEYNSFYKCSSLENVTLANGFLCSINLSASSKIYCRNASFNAFCTRDGSHWGNKDFYNRRSKSYKAN